MVDAIVYKLVDCIVLVYIAVIINYYCKVFCCKHSVILINNNNKYKQHFAYRLPTVAISSTNCHAS